jgi:diphosphomevalonate decarboxylase
MTNQRLTATAVSCANIAFIKYWGNRDARLRLPVNGSISMNLDGLFTRTRVAFRPELERDVLNLNRTPISGKALERVSLILDLVRESTGLRLNAEVVSENNFPTGAGMASSAAAFAALALAASRAAGLRLSEPELSRLARRGSGSAARSVPAGFVEWLAGANDAGSYAVSIAPPEHWQIVDLIAVVKSGHKTIGSTEGHALAGESLFQPARVQDAPRRLRICRQAILERDFAKLAEIVELDSNLMHAVMMTSRPPLFYWEPASLTLIKLIPSWRREGLPVCYTLDAGPNVHVLCLAEVVNEIRQRLERIQAIQAILQAGPGEGARCVEEGAD